jgi:hypothetical protein
MNFFRVLLDPQHEERGQGERRLISAAANILQVGEFQLLQLAYREWYGSDLPVALVDRLFTNYMLHNDVPPWARHYARLILSRDDRGALDPHDAHYHRYDHEYGIRVPNAIRKLCLIVCALVMTMVTAILLAEMTVKEPTSLLPPYFERDDIRQRTVPETGSRAVPAQTSAPSAPTPPQPYDGRR